MNSLLLSLFASLSTLIGLIFIKCNSKKVISYSFAFASGVMISVSLFDLIPESFYKLSFYFKIFPNILIVLIFIVFGVIISMLIDKYITVDNNIYRVGIISMIAIIIHNIPEGIATFVACNIDIKLGITLATSIALHNIPEGVIVALPIYYSTNSFKRAFIYTFMAGFSEFAGSLVALFFLKDYINNFFIGIILSIIAGIMIQVSIYELIPNFIKEKSRRVVGYFMVGFIIMLISIFVI
ncbi:MAG: ZIP family metal transporter [Bacilli bacterium]|nr:ZIP family metal transporter [Bacilli bacterium]